MLHCSSISIVVLLVLYSLPYHIRATGACHGPDEPSGICTKWSDNISTEGSKGSKISKASASVTFWLFRPRPLLPVGGLPTLAAALEAFSAFLAFLASLAAFFGGFFHGSFRSCRFQVFKAHHPRRPNDFRLCRTANFGFIVDLG